MPRAEPPFWKTKALEDMSPQEWESLCDGCARCCLCKLEDADTGKVFYTDVACRLLDLEGCRCMDYPNRHRRVPGCVQLCAETLHELHWMPATCAYRLLAEGGDLPPWHPLVSSDPDTVHAEGISVRHRVVPECEDTDLESHIITWPA
jgi:uncharacterized cysteine cluster protein YcgN (CxxCxxCC family)